MTTLAYDFGADLGDLVHAHDVSTAPDRGTALATAIGNLCDAAGILFPVQLRAALQDHADATEAWVLELYDWAAGAIDGGPNDDGHYPISNRNGFTTLVPGLKRLIADIAKGDPGLNARHSIGLFWGGTYGPSELLIRTRIPDAETYNLTKCEISCEVAPTADRTVTLTVNGAAWGTGTILAGQTIGTLTIPTPTIPAGGYLRVYAPSTSDPTLTGLGITLAGDQE